jgi:hypothetical protein
MRTALALLVWGLLASGCGGGRRAAQAEPAPRTSTPHTRAPNGQWTAEDIATFETLATGRAGTFIDIDHLTPQQLASVARSIRAVVAQAEPAAHEERRTLLLWALGTQQVHIVVSARASEIVPTHADHSYLIELTLALGGAVIETPDGVEQQLRGLTGLLTYYEAARAAGAAQQPVLDALLADRDAGRLPDRAAEQAHGLAAGSVEPTTP